ncbi:MAG: exodeoxyribonuclease VII small subunit [Candidatus Latescibacteria bacterium]|nr:exodeoxyribonuclease VII small subunit [Candidatus Latescibacterota bacterium]
MDESTSFEEALAVLEDNVARLEDGELDLEQALAVFEQGIAASRVCSRWLDQTRKRVQVLLEGEEQNMRLDFLDGEQDQEQSP